MCKINNGTEKINAEEQDSQLFFFVVLINQKYAGCMTVSHSFCHVYNAIAS